MDTYNVLFYCCPWVSVVAGSDYEATSKARVMLAAMGYTPLEDRPERVDNDTLNRAVRAW